MEQVMQRRQELEEEVVRLQNELVNVQHTSNEVVQQALTASEANAKELEEKLSLKEKTLAEKGDT